MYQVSLCSSICWRVLGFLSCKKSKWMIDCSIRKSVLRIRMHLSLSDPDPPVRGTDPDADPDSFLNKQKSKKNLYFYCFCYFFRLFIFETFKKYVISRKTILFKLVFLLATWRSMTKIGGSASASGSGSAPKCHGSAIHWRKLTWSPWSPCSWRGRPWRPRVSRRERWLCRWAARPDQTLSQRPALSPRQQRTRQIVVSKETQVKQDYSRRLTLNFSREKGTHR